MTVERIDAVTGEVVELTEAEAQIVLDALVQQPYIAVAAVVAKLQQQAAEQMQPPGHTSP